MISVIVERPELVPEDVVEASNAFVDIAAELLETRIGATFGEVTIAIVTDGTIVQLHDRYFGDPTPTDVITFPSDASPQLLRWHAIR